MNIQFKKRAVGVINVTNKGAFLITLTNSTGVVNRAKYNSLENLGQDIQNIGWFTDAIQDIPNDPNAGLSKNETVVGTVTITTGNIPPVQVDGDPVLIEAYVIATNSLPQGVRVDIAARIDGYTNMARIAVANCHKLLQGASNGSNGNLSQGQVGGGQGH